MNWCLVAIAIGSLILSSAGRANARDLGSLYDDATLMHLKPAYQSGVQRNFAEVILPRLTAEERRALAGVHFEFPLRGTGNDPFTYYATFPPPTVNLPVLSLKFFDDISVALAWLQRNRYAVETPYEYIGTLKYAEPGNLGGRYPPPLEALHIPDQALRDQSILDLSEKIFDSAIAFVLLHELGHIRFGHPGNGPNVPSAVSRANEEAADRFALEIMRRCETSPTGMAFLFIGFMHGMLNRGDFGSEADYQHSLQSATHPLTEGRLRSLAKELSDSAADFARNEPNPIVGRARIQSIANQLSFLGDTLGDPDAQRLIDRIDRTTTLAMLTPRRPGELPAPDGAAGSGASGPFNGTFTGEIDLPDGSVPVKTMLRRDGNRVSGEYYYGAGRGTLNGVVEKGSLVFEWREGAERGHGAFRLDSTGRGFEGNWSFAGSDHDGRRWTGVPVER